MRPASEYVVLDKEVDFYTITHIASLRNEVALGYKKQEGSNQIITTNPNKNNKVSFAAKDYIIVIAND